LLISGDKEEAAREYLKAFAVEPELEKAWRNKAHAYLLLGDVENGLNASDEGVRRHPESAPLWALLIAARQAAGEAIPERGVPAHILSTTDVSFTLSNVRYKQGRLEESYDLIRRCVEVDSPTLETKRAYLAAALTWASADPVAAYFGQLSAKQQDALSDALRRLEQLETTLAGLQTEESSLELTSNVTTALMLRDDFQRARSIAKTALVRHPLAENLLRVRIGELNEHDDIEGLRALAKDRLGVLPPSSLTGLAEIAANHKDLEWHNQVMAVLRERPLSQRQRQDLEALSADASWLAGKRPEAVAMAQALVSQHPGHVMTHVMLSRMLNSLGEPLPAAAQCAQALDLVQPDEATFADLLLVADLLYDRGLHSEAADVYARLVKTPGDNTLTQRYLACLVESDRRSEARRVLDALSAQTLDTSPFRRIESNLARRMGDWARMRDLLRKELSTDPKNASVAVGYAGAMHRIGPAASTELRDYLASDPVFDGKHPSADIELGKYQAAQGFKSLALRRMYRVFRSHPNNASLAGYFLARVMLGAHAEDLAQPLSVGPGTTVHLRGGNETRVVAIDFDSIAASAWPELVASDSELAILLQGKAVGDSVALSRGLGDVAYEVVGFESTYTFAANRAYRLIAESANPGGPLWSVNIAKSDGNLDIEPLLASAREKTAVITSALNDYVEQRFPLATLAKTVGASTLDLMLDWPSAKASLFVSIGTEEERQAGLATLKAGDKRFVIDLPTLGEMVATGVFRAVAPLLGRPLVPTTVRQELAGIIEYQTQVPSRLSIREENGRYYRDEVSIEQFDRRMAFLREMHACIDELCELTPVAGPAVHGPANQTFELMLDDATLDAVYLALERDAVLLSEDAGLRLQVPQLDLVNVMGLQPLLMFAKERGVITHDTYVNVISSKLARNHDFVSVRTEDLVLLCHRDATSMSPSVVTALNTFHGKSLDVASGVLVAGDMLANIAGSCPPEHHSRLLPSCARSSARRSARPRRDNPPSACRAHETRHGTTLTQGARQAATRSWVAADCPRP